MIYGMTVTVSARPAKDRPGAANLASGLPGLGVVDMRGGSPVRAGAFPYDGGDLVTGWHSHDLHQIEYAARGTVEVETASGLYLLPPQQAAWIPAGFEHQATINSAVRTVAVLLDPHLVPAAGDRVLAYTQDHLGSVTAGAVARAVRVSERTLRQRLRPRLRPPLRGDALGLPAPRQFCARLRRPRPAGAPRSPDV